MSDSVYYQHAGRIPIAQRISRRARRMVLKEFFQRFNPNAESSVLDVGVSLDVENHESNLLEQVYPYPQNLTCAGIGDGSAVRRAFPGVQFVQITPHTPLPFPDRSFEIVYSNAVVEHVGSRSSQRAFVHELCRVGRSVFIATPNRMFPVEHHTGIPFIHYLPLGVARALLRRTRYRFWSEESNLNPLFAGDLKELLPEGRPVHVAKHGIGLGPFRSNLVAVVSPAQS